MARCSIIIPAYNAERYVADTIRSALTQSYTDREVIVVNDGSTDGTATAIAPFVNQIVYIEQANRGSAAARNRAIAASSGELIAPLDADDLWLPEALERIVEHMDRHPEFGMVTTTTKRRVRPFRTENQAFWMGQYNFLTATPVIRRELFERHGLFDETLRATEDWELWMRFLARGERVGAIEGAYFIYRRHSESKTANLEAQAVRCRDELEQVVARGMAIRGITATLADARGRAAVATGDARRARAHFVSTVMDRSGAARTRLRALPFVFAPALSWRWYSRRVARARRRAFVRGAQRAAEAGYTFAELE